MKVITKNNEELNVTEILTQSDEGITKNLFPNEIHRFIFELKDKSASDLKSFELARFGRISVAFNNEKSKEDDIELSLWDEDFETRWTIASFEKDYDDDYWAGYELKSCGNRLDDKDINYSDFGKAVQYAYKILNKYYKENYKED